jgi:(p)ppGpp synthase/HD superfamily hydrolase
MVKQRKVIDAISDKKGNISAVKIQGNKSFTPIKTAIKMTDNNELSNVVAVHPQKGKPYLRSKPDSKTSNNLDEMAKK